MRFYQTFAEFYPNAEATIEHTKQHPTLEDEPGKDDLLFLTSIPWVSFTGIMHPIHMHPVDSVPRFAWGKFFKENDRIMLPLSVQVHHALMDGFHVGRYYHKIAAIPGYTGILVGINLNCLQITLASNLPPGCNATYISTIPYT